MKPGEIFIYVVALGAVAGVLAYGDILRNWYTHNDQKTEYDLIRTYLLNDTPLYGNNKPKLWVHSKYELNARRWKSFQSRTSTDLNQPYLHMTIQSIVNQCGEDFHVCLIDDESFSKLIPSWDVDMKMLPDPLRSTMRQIGLTSLVYYFGGMVVPDSFLCMRSLLPLYQRASHDKPFVAERLNRTTNILHENKRPQLFIADAYFMGARKNDAAVLEYLEYIKDQNRVPHFSSEHNIVGNNSWWLENASREGKFVRLDGGIIGVKTLDGNAILIEDLLGEDYLNIEPHVFGIYIPEDELLKRTQYQWFSVMSSDQILSSRLILAKYLAASTIESNKPSNTSSNVPQALDSVDRIVVV